MTDIERLEERIEELERARFLLAMKDRWSREDFSFDTQLVIEIRELREKIRRLKEVANANE